MKRICAAGAVTKGIDLSHWEPVQHWDAVKLAGAEFSFFKATEGLRALDNTFKTDWVTAKKYGIIRGAYHYFRALEDPIQQANLFLQSVTLKATDLPPVLDVEIVSNEQATSTEFVTGVRKWLQTVQQRTGRTPLVYTGSASGSAI